MGETIVTILFTFLGIVILILSIVIAKKMKDVRKKLDNIYAVITVSKLTSIIDISRILALNSEETRTLIKKLIEEAKNNKDYRLLKNAYIDHQHDKIVLDPNAGNNTFARAVDSVLGSLFPKKEGKVD